jgi:hemerythrin-like metal-binding protein
MLAAVDRPFFGKRLLLGHDAIDDEHRAIADGWQRAVNCEQLQFPFLIARLKTLLRVHFDHEAALMHLAGGTLCQCHRNEHQMLLNLCDQASAQAGTNWRRAQSLLRNKFPRLMRSHIVEMDQIVVLFINTNREATQAQ